MQLITVYFWIIGIIVMTSTSTVICKAKRSQQHQKQRQFLVQADNRILSEFPEFIYEIQRNAKSENRNENKNNYYHNYNINYNSDENISPSSISSTSNSVSSSESDQIDNVLNSNSDMRHYNQNTDDMMIDIRSIYDDRYVNDKPNNIDDIEVMHHGNGLSKAFDGKRNNNFENKKNMDNLNQNINMCKNSLLHALIEHDKLDHVLKKFDALSGTSNLEEMLNSTDSWPKNEKRATVTNGHGCDCQIETGIMDLGYSHYPRYLFSAVCQDNPTITATGIAQRDERKIHSKRCRRGSQCKPVEYNVRVLTYRNQADNIEKDHTTSLLPDILRSDWKWKTVTVAAGCFCSY